MFPYGSHAARRSLIPFIADLMSRLDVADFTLQTLRLRLYVTYFTSQASRRRLYVAATSCCGLYASRLYAADFMSRTLRRRLCVAETSCRDFASRTLRGLYVVSICHLCDIWITFGLRVTIHWRLTRFLLQMRTSYWCIPPSHPSHRDDFSSGTYSVPPGVFEPKESRLSG